MPIFRFDKAFGIARSVNAFLKNPEGSITHGTLPDPRQHEDQAEDPKDAWRHMSEQRKRIKQEIPQLKSGLRAAEEQTKRAQRDPLWRRISEGSDCTSRQLKG